MAKTKKPVAKKPVAKKPAVKKPAVKKPAAKAVPITRNLAKLKVPLGGLVVGDAVELDPAKVEKIKRYFSGLPGKPRSLKMPDPDSVSKKVLAHRDDFDIRWLSAVQSAALADELGLPDTDDYMDPWDENAERIYMQVNTMIYLTRNYTLDQLFGWKTTPGEKASVLLRYMLERIDDCKAIPLDGASKPKGRQAIKKVIDWIEDPQNNRTGLRFRELLVRPIADDLKKNVLDPFINLVNKEKVTCYCIPFIWDYIGMHAAHEDEFDRLKGYTLWAAHTTPAAAVPKKKASPKKYLEPIYGSQTNKGDPGGNNYKCTENPPGTFKCVRLNTYYCNPTPNGSCSIV